MLIGMTDRSYVTAILPNPATTFNWIYKYEFMAEYQFGACMVEVIDDDTL